MRDNPDVTLGLITVEHRVDPTGQSGDVFIANHRPMVSRGLDDLKAPIEEFVPTIRKIGGTLRREAILYRVYHCGICVISQKDNRQELASDALNPAR